jgi:hypothetical protein
MLGYWPYATHKKTNFDIYVYLQQLRRKLGILNTRFVYIFLQHKKNSDFKINILENKSLSLSFTFFVKKTACPAGSLAQASDPAGHKSKRAQSSQ